MTLLFICYGKIPRCPDPSTNLLKNILVLLSCSASPPPMIFEEGPVFLGCFWIFWGSRNSLESSGLGWAWWLQVLPGARLGCLTWGPQPWVSSLWIQWDREMATGHSWCKRVYTWFYVHRDRLSTRLTPASSSLQVMVHLVSASSRSTR